MVRRQRGCPWVASSRSSVQSKLEAAVGGASPAAMNPASARHGGLDPHADVQPAGAPRRRRAASPPTASSRASRTRRRPVPVAGKLSAWAPCPGGDRQQRRVAAVAALLPRLDDVCDRGLDEQRVKPPVGHREVPEPLRRRGGGVGELAGVTGAVAGAALSAPPGWPRAGARCHPAATRRVARTATIRRAGRPCPRRDAIACRWCTSVHRSSICKSRGIPPTSWSRATRARTRTTTWSSASPARLTTPRMSTCGRPTRCPASPRTWGRISLHRGFDALGVECGVVERRLHRGAPAAERARRR